jgi:predicted transcriptional regulator
MENIVAISPRVIEMSRKFGKMDIELYLEDTLVGKALLMAQLIDHRP